MRMAGWRTSRAILRRGLALLCFHYNRHAENKAVSFICMSEDGVGPTGKLLTVWDRQENGTVVNIVDSLRRIGIKDVYKTFHEMKGG